MDPVLNPYTPNAGAQPPAVVGRDDLIQSFAILLARLATGKTSQSMIITGHIDCTPAGARLSSLVA